MPHYVIVTGGAVTRTKTTSIDPNFGWKEDGKGFAPPLVETTVPRARAATTYQLMSALTDAQRAAYPGPIKVWDQRLFGARDTPWPETNEKIGRIADALGTTAKMWFDAALGAG